MADEVIPPVVAAPVAEVAAVVAPVAPAVVEQPVVVEAPAPVVAEPAPVVAPEVKPAEVVAAETPLAEPTLLEKFDAKKAAEEAAKKPMEPEKPAEVKAEEKPAEIKVEAQPEVKPTAEPLKFEYKLPENVTLAEPMKVELEGILNDFHANPTVEVQQKLMDFHFDRLKDFAKEYDRQAHAAFYDTRRQWQKEVENDPEVGGNNHDTAMQSVAYVRDNFVSLEPRNSKAYTDAKENLDKWMHYTGAGDNPAFIRLMHNISTALNEPTMNATSDIKPVVEIDRNTGGRPPIYRHPTSQRNGR